MTVYYKVWTYIEKIDEDEDHYCEEVGIPKGVFEVFDTFEEAREYQETMLGE